MYIWFWTWLFSLPFVWFTLFLSLFTWIEYWQMETQNVCGFCRHFESTICFISSPRLLLYATSNMVANIAIGGWHEHAWILNLFMLSTRCFTYLAVLRFEIIFDWKLSLTRLLRLISLAHRTTKLPFSVAQEPNLLAPSNSIEPGFFFCPE